MISVQLVSLALLLVPSVLSQILNPPTNVSTGFVRLEGPQALSISPQPLPAEQITWFYTPNGLVAVDGDIIYGTAEDFNRNVLNLTYNSASGLNAAEGNDTTPARRSLRPLAPRSNSVFPNSDGVWPNGNVKYRYIDDATEEELGVYVEGAIAAWKAAVPCISFTKLPNGFGQSDGTTTINANRPNGGYCLASLGYSPFGTFMSLDTGGACGVPEMIHEIGKLPVTLDGTRASPRCTPVIPCSSDLPPPSRPSAWPVPRAEAPRLLQVRPLRLPEPDRLPLQPLRGRRRRQLLRRALPGRLRRRLLRLGLPVHAAVRPVQPAGPGAGERSVPPNIPLKKAVAKSGEQAARTTSTASCSTATTPSPGPAR